MYIIYIFRTIVLILLLCPQCHIWREKGDHRSLWDQVEIIDKEHHWKIRTLKESAHMLDHKNLLG